MQDGGPNANYGGTQSMCACRGDQVGYHRHSLVKFDLSAYAGWTMEPGTQPIVELWLAGMHTAGWKGNPVRADLITGRDWDEMSVTYNSFFAAGQALTPLVTHTVYDSQVGRYHTWPIPDWVVQDWLDHPSTNYGLLFESLTNINKTDAWFHTREVAGHEPRITFEAIPEPGTLILLIVGGVLLFICRGNAWASRR